MVTGQGLLLVGGLHHHFLKRLFVNLVLAVLLFLFNFILKFSILGLGPPLTSNTSEFVTEQVQSRRQPQTSSLARSSFADVFRLGAGAEVEASLDSVETGLKSGARKHLVGS